VGDVELLVPLLQPAEEREPFLFFVLALIVVEFLRIVQSPCCLLLISSLDSSLYLERNRKEIEDDDENL